MGSVPVCQLTPHRFSESGARLYLPCHADRFPIHPASIFFFLLIHKAELFRYLLASLFKNILNKNDNVLDDSSSLKPYYKIDMQLVCLATWGK